MTKLITRRVDFQLIEHQLNGCYYPPTFHTYTPITATEMPLFDDKSPIWDEQTMMDNSYVFDPKHRMLSTDAGYSSIADAGFTSLEELRICPKYKDYKYTEFPREAFKATDAKPDFDIDRRRQLGFYPVWFGNEQSSFNDGKNILDNTTLITHKRWRICRH